MEAAAQAKTEIEEGAEQAHKKWFFEVHRGLEKNLGTRGGYYFEGDKI